MRKIRNTSVGQPTRITAPVKVTRPTVRSLKNRVAANPTVKPVAKRMSALASPKPVVRKHIKLPHGIRALKR